MAMVSNDGRVGDVISVSVKPSNSDQWEELAHNWGQNWQTGNSQLVGQSRSFSVTTSDGKTAISSDVAPPDRQFSQTFEGN